MASGGGGGGDPWEYSLRKYLLLLATVTYAAGFNPPGGVWQDTDTAAGRLAGDPIIREASYRRYMVFFYCNATAFASSLVVMVLILVLAALHDRGSASLAPLRSLRVVMTLDLLSLMGAYAPGTFRDTFTTVYAWVLLAGVVFYLALRTALSCLRSEGRDDDDIALERLRKVLMLLATFAVSVTYVAGLNAPGGFWDHAEGGHRPGHGILKGGRHDARLKVFFVSNTTAFVASLLIIVVLLQKKMTFYSKMVKGANLAMEEQTQLQIQDMPTNHGLQVKGGNLTLEGQTKLRIKNMPTNPSLQGSKSKSTSSSVVTNFV